MYGAVRRRRWVRRQCRDFELTADDRVAVVSRSGNEARRVRRAKTYVDDQRKKLVDLSLEGERLGFLRHFGRWGVSNGCDGFARAKVPTRSRRNARKSFDVLPARKRNEREVSRRCIDKQFPSSHLQKLNPFYVCAFGRCLWWRVFQRGAYLRSSSLSSPHLRVSVASVTRLIPIFTEQTSRDRRA